MIKKKHIGKLISVNFAYSDTVETYSGLVVDFNKKWVLMKYNPVDFMVDGYLLLRRRWITDLEREKREKFFQKVIEKKGAGVSEADQIPLGKLGEILEYLTGKEGAFQFSMENGEYVYVASLVARTDGGLNMKFINSRGKWADTEEVVPRWIRTVQFGTDYVNSLLLMAGADEEISEEEASGEEE